MLTMKLLVKKALSEVYSNIGTYHKKLYDSVVSLGAKINALPPSLPLYVPTRPDQTNRENMPSNTPEEYFRRAGGTIPFFPKLAFFFWYLS